MYQPSISFIIPTFKRDQYLFDLIQSIKDTTPNDADYDLIVVSSDDPSGPKVEKLQTMDRVVLLLPDVRTTVRMKSNYYYINMGIKASSKEWCFVLSDDMLFPEGWYELLVDVFVHHPKDTVVMVASQIGSVDEYRIIQMGWVRKPGKDWVPAFMSELPIMRRDIAEKIGYFDENAEFYGSGFDTTMAVILLTDTQVIAEPRIQIAHFRALEQRAENANCDGVADMAYLNNKWDTWVAEHNCEYVRI